MRHQKLVKRNRMAKQSGTIALIGAQPIKGMLVNEFVNISMNGHCVESSGVNLPFRIFEESLFVF